jgi:hypothetical protein
MADLEFRQNLLAQPHPLKGVRDRPERFKSRKAKCADSKELLEFVLQF